MDIRPQELQHRHDIRIAELHDVIHRPQRRNQVGTRSFVQDRPPRSLQPAHARIIIHCHYQYVPLAPCAFQITNVSHVQRVKASVRKHNALSVALPLRNRFLQFLARHNFGRRAGHFYASAPEASARITASNSSRDTVAVPRFITTSPPAIFAMCAASSAEAPVPSASEYAASTVSPAPVTSTA